MTSERVNALDAGAEVFYRRLMSKVDDHGLYDARPSILRASLYPLRVDRVREADCTRWIAACEMAGLIALYTHDGKPYLQMLDTRWTARSEPKYPIPSDCDSTKPVTTENNCAQLKTPVPVFGVVVVDEVVSSPAPSGAGYFDEFWKAYPNKAGKDAARKAFAKRKVTRELLDEMLAAIAVQRQSKKWTDDAGQYIPNPATWLNAGCWQDEGVQISAPITVPGREGPDPALAKIEADRLKAAPIPENIRQQLQSLRGNGVPA